MMIIAKIKNQIVQIVQVKDTVGFSAERGWVCICSDFEQQDRRKQHFRWIPASTRFEWVREFKFGE